MQRENNSARRLNLYLSLAIILGLMASVLIVIPNFVSPTWVRQQASLQVAAKPSPTPLPGAIQPTPIVTPTLRPSSQVPACRRYTIQAGDTLSSLARRFGTTAVRIAVANDLHSDSLAIGQILVICGVQQISQLEVPAPTPTAVEFEPPTDVWVSLTYPTDVHNRKPQWITLIISESQAIGATGAGLLPDVVETTQLESVPLPVPKPPRTSPDRTATLIEHWLLAQLTGSDVVPRSRSMNDRHPLTAMLTDKKPPTWQWLFTPSASGDYLFGLDVFSSGEFEILDADGNIVSTVQTNPEAVWSRDFTISVDEIFGIPRRWWLLASALGALLNLILGITQIAAGAA